MSWLHALIGGLWIVLPAYIANGAAPVFGGGARMDFGKKLRGKDLLGAGKTWRGFFSAVASGTFIGLLQIVAWPRLNEFAAGLGYSLPMMTLTTAFILSTAAMLGDVIASFFKRRFSIERGGSVPLLDQLDFMVLSIPAALLLSEITYSSAAILVVITPPIHYLFNLLGYYIGVKDVPW